jgi:hypothetical protein
MRIVYRSGVLEHVHEARSAEGRILGIIAKTLPQEVAAIAHNGTEAEPEWTTKDDLAAAIRAIQSRLGADPGLLLAFACSVESQGDGEPEDAQFKRGSGFSGIRLPDKPSDHVYSLWCGPGKCDLEESTIGSNGRGTVVATLDIRGEEELQTANMGRIRIHRRPVKVPIVDEMKWLLAAVESWPAGKVAKFAESQD